MFRLCRNVTRCLIFNYRKESSRALLEMVGAREITAETVARVLAMMARRPGYPAAVSRSALPQLQVILTITLKY